MALGELHSSTTVETPDANLTRSRASCQGKKNDASQTRDTQSKPNNNDFRGCDRPLPSIHTYVQYKLAHSETLAQLQTFLDSLRGPGPSSISPVRHGKKRKSFRLTRVPHRHTAGRSYILPTTSQAHTHYNYGPRKTKEKCWEKGPRPCVPQVINIM